MAVPLTVIPTAISTPIRTRIPVLLMTITTRANTAHTHIAIHQNSRDCSTGSGQSVTNRFLVRPMTSLRNIPQPERFTDDLGLNKGKQELMRLMLPFLCAVLLSGCINITNELQPGTPDVKPVLIGEDCTPIVLGMGLGTNTIENAKKDGRVLGDPGEFRSRIKLNDRTAITRIRTVQMTDFYILLVGSSCIQVIGEP